jgi:zinc protease
METERSMRYTIQTRRISVVAGIFLLILLSLSTGSFASEPLGKRIVLENGAVLLLSEKHDIPMVTVTVAVKAGNMTAPVDNPGLASITASLLMQGTSKRTAGQISEKIDFIGGSLSTSGGDDFASASLKVLKKDLQTGLDVLSDVILNPVFDQKEIDRKVKAVLADIRRKKEEPSVVAYEAFQKAVFGKHPYGITGDDESDFLPKMTRQNVLAFYSSRYSPNNAVIAVVGDVTEKEIVGLLNNYLRPWQKKDLLPPEPVQTPRIDKTTVQKIQKNVTQANIVIGHRGISRENPDYYAVLIMNYILGGGGFSSRLVDTIRDNRGLAYDVHSLFSAQKEPGTFSVSVRTKNESANDVIEEVLKEIRRMQTDLVSEKELADAKAYLTGSFPLRMDTYAKIAGILTSLEIYNLGLDYADKYPTLINSVTREDILRVAQKYLHPDNSIIVVVADQGKAKLSAR